MKISVNTVLLTLVGAQAVAGALHRVPARLLEASRNAILKKPHSHSHQKNKDSSSSCNSQATIAAKAPRQNIFQGFSDDDFANITSFLHQQKSLNLTAASNATRQVILCSEIQSNFTNSWDNIILSIDILHPNKSDALPFLDSGASAPPRYARATLRYGATLEPYVREYMVGPLPVITGKTTATPLDYIYNKGKGYQRLYNVDEVELAMFNYKVGASVQNATLKIFNGVREILSFQTLD
jgi:primary-amine oxidase